MGDQAAPGLPGSLQCCGAGAGLGSRLGTAAGMRRGADGKAVAKPIPGWLGSLFPCKAMGELQAAVWALSPSPARQHCPRGQPAPGPRQGGPLQRALLRHRWGSAADAHQAPPDEPSALEGSYSHFSVAFDRWKDFLIFPSSYQSQRLQHFSIHVKPGIYSKGAAAHRHSASGWRAGLACVLQWWQQ